MILYEEEGHRGRKEGRKCKEGRDDDEKVGRKNSKGLKLLNIEL